MSAPVLSGDARHERPLPGQWPDLHRQHREAIEAFATTAAQVPPSRWTEPMAPGKWSPAELTLHLALAVEIMLHELATGERPQVITTWWQRAVLRYTVRPKLLAGGKFPRVRSPREARPAGPPGEQGATIDRLRARGAELEAAIDAAARARPRTRLTHPYLGAFSLREALRFSALHVRHHLAQLQAAIAPAASSE